MRSRIFTFVKCLVLYVFTVQPLLSPYARVLLQSEPFFETNTVFAASNSQPTAASLLMAKRKSKLQASNTQLLDTGEEPEVIVETGTNETGTNETGTNET